jgi:transcriptional regulator with XRE-family HTH domain
MSEDLRRSLGEVARAARQRLGLTQEEVARKVGLVPIVYGRVERGGMLPSVPTLRKLCQALRISADELLLLRGPEGRPLAEAPCAEPGEPPELSRILRRLRSWPPERLVLARKLLRMVEAHLPPTRGGKRQGRARRSGPGQAPPPER